MPDGKFPTLSIFPSDLTDSGVFFLKKVDGGYGFMTEGMSKSVFFPAEGILLAAEGSRRDFGKLQLKVVVDADITGDDLGNMQKLLEVWAESEIKDYVLSGHAIGVQTVKPALNLLTNMTRWPASSLIRSDKFSWYVQHKVEIHQAHIEVAHQHNPLFFTSVYFAIRHLTSGVAL